MKLSARAVSDKVFIITGASSGIGRACSILLSELGGKVCMASRSKEMLEQVKREAGPKVGNSILVCEGDVTQDEDCEKVIRATLGKYGTIDVLINNAGIGLFRSSWETSLSEYQHIMDVNFFGALRLTLKVLPFFISQNKGHIINVASVAGRRAFPNAAAYCSSKFALRGFTEALRQELKEAGASVKVSLVYPIATHTPFFQKAGDPDYERTHHFTSVMKAEEVAEHILSVAVNGGKDLIITRRARVIDKIHSLFPYFVERMNAKALQRARDLE